MTKTRNTTSAEGEPPSALLDENLETIARWEKAALHRRSRAEQFSDRITVVIASGPVLVFHAVWFVVWIVLNTHLIAGVKPFDPFPFPLLTMTVSLEAIFLALFVLASQNRLANHSEKRAHLDLQIDMLAEREMTAILQLLDDITTHLKVKVSVTPDQIRELIHKTDVGKLADRLDRIPSPEQDRGGE